MVIGGFIDFVVVGLVDLVVIGLIDFIVVGLVNDIFDLLIEKGIPFIDVGMGLNRKKGPIDGMLRVTYYSAERSKELREMGLAEINDQPEDIYRANIQISELNALNAALAVIRFKQLRGFYSADPAYEHALFTIADLHNTGDEEVGDED